MTDSLERFVTVQNISHYRHLLTLETHPDKRSILRQLLENELAKLPEAVKRAEMIKSAGFR